MEFSGNGYRLRQWALSDGPGIAKYANNRKIWRNLSGEFPYPYTEEDAARWLGEVARGAFSEDVFVIEIENEAVGVLGIKPMENVHRKSLGLGYWLGEPFWGRGIMSDVVLKVTDEIFRSRDAVRIQASVFGWNAASGRVLEKAGFSLEGRLRKAIYKDGEFTDELIYGKLRP